ncbi:MAG: M48 family metalloprotease [Gammaproteobacteria bacterium]|nr:M48 family metalloprotease [Gammaproteobacteria bacterium]
MSRAKQYRAGQKFLRQARATWRFLHDPEVTTFMGRLGERLVAASPSPQLHFRFFVLQNPVVNAFSVPGGFVFANTGVILAAQNEDELAAVLSHEISHVTQRHIARLMALSSHLTWGELLGLLAGAALLGASQYNGGMAALSVSSASLANIELQHRRGYESEADHIGLRTMARAGFNPHAMGAFFIRLKTADRFMSDSAIPESWRTHPATDIRISEAEELAARYPDPPIPDRPAFDRLQAAVAADALSPRAARRWLITNLQARGDRQALRFGLGLVALRAGHWRRAQARLSVLLARHPDVVAYHLARARLALRMGDVRGAIRQLQQAARLRAGSVRLAASADAMLLEVHPRTALRAIKRLVNHYPERAALYRLLARAFAYQHDYVHAHEALAEAEYLDGDSRGALRDLRFAAALATTPQAKADVAAQIAGIHNRVPVPPAFP